jgi:hypothetical protein
VKRPAFPPLSRRPEQDFAWPGEIRACPSCHQVITNPKLATTPPNLRFPKALPHPNQPSAAVARHVGRVADTSRARASRALTSQQRDRPVCGTRDKHNYCPLRSWADHGYDVGGFSG